MAAAEVLCGQQLESCLNLSGCEMGKVHTIHVGFLLPFMLLLLAAFITQQDLSLFGHSLGSCLAHCTLSTHFLFVITVICLKKKQHIYFFNRTWPVLYKITNTWLIKTPDWHMWLLLFPIGNTMQIKHRFIYSRLCGQTLLLLSCPADSHWPRGEISCTLCILVFLKTWMKDKTLDCTSVLNVSRIPNKEIQDPVFEVQEHSFQMAEYWL